MRTTIWIRLVHTLMGYFRKRRIDLLRQACPELFDDSEIRILDLGGSRHFWEHLPIDLSRKHIVIYNISDHATGAVRSDAAETIPVRIYDGKRLPVADKSFDLVVSNSVIEHVPVEQRARFAREILRVGSRYMLQTPAYGFPVEPHFIFPGIHWLPRAVGRKVARVTPLAMLSGSTPQQTRDLFDEIRLLTRREVDSLLPGSTMHDERLLGLTKSYIACGTTTA